MMSIAMGLSYTWPLALSLRIVPVLTLVGMALSVPTLYSVVGFAVHGKKNDINNTIESALMLCCRSFGAETAVETLRCTIAGFILPAAQVMLVTGQVATAVAAAATGFTGACGIFFLVVGGAEEAQREEGW